MTVQDIPLKRTMICIAPQVKVSIQFQCVHVNFCVITT